MITRLLILVLTASFLGWLLCDINPDKYYTWYSGIWHGIFFVPNFIRSLFFHAEYKAVDYSTGYNVFYWIFAIGSTFSFFFGGRKD